MKKLIFAFLVLAMGAGCGTTSGGSVQKDPIFKHNKGTAKDNLIVRDKNGHVTGYMVRDPILKDNWIYFPRSVPDPMPATSPGPPPATATDSVGE